MKKQFNWSEPQRQPIAGLAIVFLNTFWEILKRIWPVALVILLGREGQSNRYEIIAAGFLGFTIISAILNFIFFKFYIEEDKLIIKKGWYKKITQVIPLQKIQTVDIEQGPLHQLLNIVKLSIDTAGSQKAEAKIDALHKSMAEALRLQIMAEKHADSTQSSAPVFHEPLITLNGRDLLKLSISANHVEAFFIILSFGIGLYDNLRGIDDSLFSNVEDLFPQNAIYPILFLVIAVLLITILVSTARIFFRFYDFNVLKTPNGFHIRSGLTNIKQRLISFQKIQYVSWKANWIRKLMNLWMLEYHTATGDETRTNLKVQVPVTQKSFIPILTKDYHPLPEIEDQPAVRMHPSFITRRILITGILPSLIIMPLMWLAWDQLALYFLVFPVMISVSAICIQRKFRLWMQDDIVYISKGIFGEEKILMQWYKLQSIEIRQSIFQRSRGLANVEIHTAAGSITVLFIPLETAQQITNYALYKTEVSDRKWM